MVTLQTGKVRSNSVKLFVPEKAFKNVPFDPKTLREVGKLLQSKKLSIG